MNLKELIDILSSEEKAEEFLRSKGILKSFNSCPFCGSNSIGRVSFSNGKVCMNGIEGFWSYAKEKPLKHHRISRENFILFKRGEFRYNNREILDNIIYKCLSGIK